MTPLQINIAFVPFAIVALIIIYWQIKERQHVKRQYYGNPCYPAYYCGFNHSVEAEGDTLSLQETNLKEILSSLPKDSVLRDCIHYTLDKGTDASFRELIGHLKKQHKDKASGLRACIGSEAYYLISQL